MTYEIKFIASRIEWCQRKSMQASAQLEREAWHAEEEGLRDALFSRDHTTQYQQRPPSLFKRYSMGLQDGHTMLRTAAVYHHFATSTRQAGTGSSAGIDGMST
jgi:hypothetical protein